MTPNITPVDKGVDIYYQGKIFTKATGSDNGSFHHTAGDPIHDCPAPHPFKDGQQVVLGKDYELRERYIQNVEPKIVAVALPFNGNTITFSKEVTVEITI